MNELKNMDQVLIVWLVCSSIFDLVCIVGVTYLVFWKGASGWWFLLAMLLCYQGTLFKALAKRYGVES